MLFYGLFNFKKMGVLMILIKKLDFLTVLMRAYDVIIGKNLGFDAD